MPVPNAVCSGAQIGEVRRAAEHLAQPLDPPARRQAEFSLMCFARLLAS